MHGNHLGKTRLWLVGIAQKGDVRAIHALEAVFEAYLARESDAHTAFELGSHPGLSKPGGDDDTRSVEDRDLEDVQTAARLLFGNLVNRAHDSHELADGRTSSRLDIGKIDVAARVVLEQVAHRHNAHLGKVLGACRTYGAHLADIAIKQEIGISTRCHQASPSTRSSCGM